MHSQSKKKEKERKSQVEKGWAENQDNSGPLIASFHYPFAFERGDFKNLHSHGVRLKDVCLWRLAWKAVSGLKWEMPQLFPIVTLCGLTEACVLIMSTSALFFCPPHTHTRVFNIACLLSSHTTSASLSSAVPEKKYGGEHVGWHGTTEPSTPIYASCGDLATDVYEVQKCAKLSASNILQPAALPRTLLTLKVWPQFGGRLKKNIHAFCFSFCIALVLQCPTFITVIVYSFSQKWK